MRKLLISAALAFTALASFTATSAMAAPTATFTSSTTTPHVGVPVRFDATGTDCNTNRCDWSWVFYNKYGQVLNGGQMGTGLVVNYTFTAFAAAKPYVIVKLKVTAPGGTNNYTLAQHAYVVT
jgi:hypothetical protein